ncbi:MAG: amino acid--tRNA ligase-related protein, partial [Ignavibacteria bacterium]
VTQEDVFEVVEGCMKEIWQKTKGIEIGTPFKRMTYEEAMENYGTDKPDLRYEMRIINITDEVKGSDFKLFNNAVESGGIAAGIKLESSAAGKEISRKKIDELTDYIKTLGFGGLIHMKFLENEISSPLKKHLGEEILIRLKDKFSAKPGDIVFILFGEREKVCESLGKLRIKLSEEYYSNKLQNKFEFLWVTDFPLFEWDESEKKITPSHHPFTSPKEEYLKYLDSDYKKDILKIKADCYDLVLNGNELGSGSIRIHNSEIQSKIFKLLGLTKEEAQKKFGFLLEAFKYGAPPHGGAAFGFDRIVALLAGQTSIKEFIAFPKTLSAVSLMDNSPSEVDPSQLDEIGIQLKN